MTIVPPHLNSTTDLNTTQADNLARATLLAGTIIHQSIFSTVFVYFLSGLFTNIGNWWQLWSPDNDNNINRPTRYVQDTVSPDGQRSVPVRDMSLLENWENEFGKPEFARLTTQSGDDDHNRVIRPGDEAERGGLWGPKTSRIGNWADEKEERERAALRTRLKNERNGSFDAVPQFVLDYGGCFLFALSLDFKSCFSYIKQ